MTDNKLELLLKAQTVLKNAKRSRKEELAFLAGFSTVEDYKKDLANRISEFSKTSAVDEPVMESGPETETKVPASNLNLVIAFDATGSMGSYIDAVKKYAQSTINEVITQQPDAKIKVVVFGDYCDMTTSKDFGKAYQEIELTNDKEALIKFIERSQKTHGGDSDEFYELVIKKIVNETKWDSNNRAILLIGDADPHPIGYNHTKIVNTVNDIDWVRECENAKDKNIKIDTLTCTESRRSLDFYSTVSSITGGLSLPFRSAGKTNDLIRGIVYARSGNKEAFAKAKADVAHDVELTGTYKTLSNIL